MTKMIIPAVALMRTDEERRDQAKSWQRDDAAFFAAGACHILAFTLKDRDVGDRYKVMHIKPGSGLSFGDHVYVTDGFAAFDFNGWTSESELIEANTSACRDKEEGWECSIVEITDDLDTFCTQTNHREPKDFFQDPRPRAQNFLNKIAGSSCDME